MDRIDHQSTSQLLRSVLALGRRLRAIRGPGARPLTGLTILGTLYRLGPLLASQLAAEEGLQPQSLTRLLAGLERKRLISRKRSDTDGRALIITLTDAGRQKLLEEIGARRTWLKSAMATALTPHEREIATSASAVLLKIAAHEAPDGPSFSAPAPKRANRITVDENLEGAAYRNVRLEKATFTDVNLHRAAFENVNLSEATFTNVNLRNVAIRDANLDGMTIDGQPISGRLRRPPDETGAEAAESSTVFHVSDLSRSLHFYLRVLGFGVDFKFGTPESYAGLSWRGVHLHLSSNYPYKNNTGHGNLYIYCTDVEALYEKLDAAGTEFYSRISHRAYGMRDFAIKDPDGNQIGFGATERR